MPAARQVMRLVRPSRSVGKVQEFAPPDDVGAYKLQSLAYFREPQPVTFLHASDVPVVGTRTSCPFRVRWRLGLLGRPLPGQWDASIIRVSLHVTISCRELQKISRHFLFAIYEVEGNVTEKPKSSNRG